MGTHRERQPFPERFREWWRYRRYYRALLAAEPRPVSPGRREELRAEARRAARLAGE